LFSGQEESPWLALVSKDRKDQKEASKSKLKLRFDPEICKYFQSRFNSASQQARVASELWATDNLPCPACSSDLESYPNNTKVKDLHCTSCTEQFQLKSGQHRFVKDVPDGQYETQIESVRRGEYPSLLLLWYQNCKVQEVTAIHKA